jgi:hypothetical protein
VAEQPNESLLQSLAKAWSPVVLGALDELGKQSWPPLSERRGLLGKPRPTVTRYTLEGPKQRGNEFVWALSHTSRPSVFDDNGILTIGERHFWLVFLGTGSPSTFRIEGAEGLDEIPAEPQELKIALQRAGEVGPRVESFYGNKGPLTHRR